MQTTQVQHILYIFLFVINSVINDSDESSFGFYGKPRSQRDESLKRYEYVKNYNKLFAENNQKLPINLKN